MILIKLGGSIITNKQKPLTPNLSAINKIVSQLKKIKEPIIVVHGGGSFGHYWSVKYDMHTKPAKYNKKGVSAVKNSMIALNKIILDSFLKNGLNPYCLPPTDFMLGNKADQKKVREIAKIAKAGLVPISYGDVMWYGKNKFYILSGDKIMGILSKILKPRLVIFTLNVDGVYSDMRSKKLLREIKGKNPEISKVEMDVTGGMSRKIKEAISISKSGTKVLLVNGNNPDRIVNAAKGKFEGTLFKR
ncbi:MAG TPA: isopentenyl phosphate kinase family protein [Nitrosopumilaceae archaeon]|nr:isopentenyl phosphate kinase family protein [Nitrosopumilaceae archaeon]